MWACASDSMIFFSGPYAGTCKSHTVYADDANLGVAFGRWTLLDNGVNKPEFLRITGCHEGVTFHDFFNLLQ